ncbi:MAG: FecR domain-containing protein [Acidobacteriota bacterium]|nr:FecR domain-containing protein [Acidobacteriota bacterium]
MTFRSYLRFAIIFVFAWSFAALQPVHTSASNARIIRLSLVQGDVRILHDSKGDPLANDKAAWTRAELNLPIRAHDVIATDSGRAEVEFENGAMAFINENSVLEFFELSLEDGSFTTRLILRQGTGSFYANPSRADYFSVTGGDFTTQAASRANFRMDNFDDGSTVAVNKGRVSVLYKEDSTTLSKGQSLTMHAGDVVSASVGRAPESDDFDRWVSGREDSVVTATNAALHYSSSYNYTSGFGDLYTYGGFYPLAGFGYGWQPYGVGIGWSPFDYGNWYFQSGLGWSFIGNQPWGWLPYHYGGWIFQPGIGWLWAPTGFGGGGLPVRFHPVTATFVRSGSTVGIVPSHPLDNHGKTPVNLAQGVMPLASRAGTAQSALATGTKWKVVKDPPREALVSHASSATTPARVARTVADSSAAVANAAQGGSSSIVYDAKERRFVNSNLTANSSTKVSSAPVVKDSASAAAARTSSGPPKAAPASARVELPSRSASARVGPPPAPRSTVFTRGASGEGGSRSRGATMQTGSAPRATSPAAAPAPRSTGRPH